MALISRGVQILLRKKIEKLTISGKDVWPIIEGGKGLGVSDGASAGAFAAADAVGTFSGANPSFIDHNGDTVHLEYKGVTRLERFEELMNYSIKAGISQAQRAHDIAQGRGRIHMNILWEMAGVQRVLNGVLEGAKGLIHGVTCGAGMPYKMAEIAEKYQVYYYPIISSARAFRALWLRSYKKFSQWLGGVVYEDPWLAGGHNGLSNKEDPKEPEPPFLRVAEVRRYLSSEGLEDCPIIIAGGVWNLKEWEQFLDSEEIGKVAFQFGTRPIVTQENSAPESWKTKLLTLEKGSVSLNLFSPTGFYSSAVNNNFLQELAERSSRQVKFSESPEGELNYPIVLGPRARTAYINLNDNERVQEWYKLGYNATMRTPDDTLIFVTPERSAEIRRDQINCMGCLSHCRFSNWKDHDNHTTGLKPDPRSYCIQKTLQDIVRYGKVDDELMFAGHNAYRFKDDPLYRNHYIPTTQELVNAILEGN